jgi:hypothetical protein
MVTLWDNQFWNAGVNVMEAIIYTLIHGNVQCTNSFRNVL